VTPSVFLPRSAFSCFWIVALSTWVSPTLSASAIVTSNSVLPAMLSPADLEVC
jgi:hypothetical protein